MTESLVILALKLAMLTFYLGVLIYALPIPLARLKKLAPESMVDAVYACLLALVIFSIYDASSRIAYHLGGSWGLFETWLLSALSVSATVKILESLLLFLPFISKISPLLSAIISPLSKMATLTIMLCVLLAAIATLVRVYGYILIGLGLVLYALPFRIGRDAGAWLIAFCLVFNIGLPLLPVFIAQLEPERHQLLSPDTFTVLRVSVTSAYGHPASFGVLVIRDESGSDIAVYELSEDGLAMSSYTSNSKIVALPTNKPLYASLQYAGVEFRLAPRPFTVSSKDREVPLTSPHLILVAKPGVIVFSSTTSHELSFKDGAWVIRVKSNTGDYIDVRYPRLCNVNVKHYGDVEIKKGIWRWRGVEGEALRFIANKPSEIGVEVSLGACETPAFSSVSTKDYLDYVATQLALVDWNIFKTYVLYYLTVPALYVTTLFLATTAVARLLGGRGRLSVRVV
ncbi:MAG: hypothetical protein QXS85_03465 [Acidilobaceae archaeon]